MKHFANLVMALLIVGLLGVAQAQQPAVAPQGRPQPKLKTQDELKAYQEATAKTSPGELELAALEFSLKFPDSEIRNLLFLNAMRAYENANNPEKVVEMGRKTLEIYPNEPDALVTIANTLASRTRETDLDKDERLADAVKNAQKALTVIDTDLLVPPTITPEQVQGIKNVMKSMAYAALGTVEMAKKNYPGAEQQFQMAANINTAQPDAVVWLRLAVSREQQKKYPEALEAANQAVKFAPAGSQAATLAASQRDRLQKLATGGSASPAPNAPTQQ